MVRTTVAIVALACLVSATAAEAQGRGKDRGNQRGKRQEIARAQGIPPGHLPPSGMCRVWYNNLPAGRQPAPTSCGQAESIAARDRSARVIYGDGNAAGYPTTTTRTGRDILRYPDSRDRDNRDPRTGGAVPRVPGRNRDPRVSRDPSSSRDVYGRTGSRHADIAFDNGYRDGLEKGREDVDDGDRFDPARHSRYRSADRGYRDEFGRKSQYKITYREGFEAGYAAGYRQRTR